ncbi:Low-density lipoprotein receptor-related protein 6, partial [Acropora cervicornis]
IKWLKNAQKVQPTFISIKYPFISFYLPSFIAVYIAAICSPPCLLFSNTTNIIALDYKTSATHSVVSGLTRAIAVDVHFSLGYIFWSDVSERNIKRSSTGGSGLTTIITGIGVCDGLAVEWRTSQLYWTDTTYDKISVSDLSGNNKRSLLSSGLDEPRDIALDPDSGVMFWTDWGSAPKIEKATLTGSQRVSIVTSNLRWPNGMELDKGNKRVYWVDGGTDRIESVNYQGNNRILLSKVKGYHPFGVAMISRFLFVTDWALRGILHKVDADSGHFIVGNYKTRGRLMGIVAYDQSRQPPVSNQCNINNGGCSHFCVVTSSSPLCVCPTGFALKQDGRTCENKLKKFFLFTDAGDKSINILSLDVNYFAAKRLFFHLGRQRPIALDFDPVEDRVYWTDVEQGLILSAFSNATALKILFRTMYWTDWGSNPKIERAAMDGSSRRSVITGNLGWPNGLTIDRSTNRLYWADAKLDKIEVSDLTGANRRLVMSSVADIHPFGLTLYQGMLYWTDWNNRSISRLDLSNGKKKMIITGLKRPMDIHLYDSSVTISGSHPCATNRTLCSDLCLLKPHGGYQCACPTGIYLKPDGRTCDYVTYYNKSSDHFMLFAEANTGEIYKVPLDVTDTPCEPLAIRDNISRPVAVDYDSVDGKVYWTDVTLKQIVRSYPNGSHLEVLATHNVINPDGIAVDWIGRNLYWTDAGTNRIEVSRLDGSFRTSLITANVDLPRAITLDIDARKMYWSDWGSSPKIEKSNMDGTDRTAIVSSGLKWVNSLALDFKNKLLYWCDASLDLIERVDLQGNNRVLVLNLTSEKYHHPFGLALYQDALFWTDWSTQSVHKYNMTSTTSEVFVYGMGRPMEIHMYDYNTITTGTTSCSQLNGGCSHICLPNPTGHRCFCPEGVQLKYADQFTCQGVNRCPQLSAPAHGSVEPCSNLPGHTCQFSCDQGYVLSGATTRTCSNDGTWTGLQTQCNVVMCTALKAPSHGSRHGCTGTAVETYNTVCLFSCSPGFNGLGSPSRKCLHNGTWSGQDFICQAISCPLLVTPLKAIKLTPSCASVYGSSCLYSCQNGYTSSSGNVTRTCLSSGQWSGNDINCTDSQAPSFDGSCPWNLLLSYAEKGFFSALVNWTNPVATDNSGLTPKVTSNFQSPQTFSQGNHVITYTAEDKSGNKATCTFTVKVIVIYCASLSVTPGGPLRMTSCGNYYGAMCNFSCPLGHRMNGSSIVTCSASGNKPPGFWDNPLPTCQENRCVALPTPPNGLKTGCSDPSTEQYGTVCSFSCKAGYKLTGSSKRQCLQNETWSGINSSCEVINCTALVPPPNCVITPSSCLSRSTYGQSCRFSCQRQGYSLEGTSVRVCGSDGEWTGTNDTICRDKSPPSFNNSCPGNMVIYLPKCSRYAQVSWNEPIVTDNSDHVIISYPALRPPANLSVGAFSIHYSAKDDEGNTANCSFIVQVAIVTCPAIKPPSHGTVSPSSCKTSSGVHYKTNCFLTCNAANHYRLEGPSKISCRENGSWSADISNIICKDIAPPNIQCPPSIAVPTDRGQSYATAFWNVPVPTDNSNEPLNLSGLRPPHRLNVGNNYIRYDVTDSTGLSSSCVFSIDVRDREAPVIDGCPGDIKVISTDRFPKLVLPGVKVTDNVGVYHFVTNIQNGSKVTFGRHRIIYTASDKAGNKAHCRFNITIADSLCEDLQAPKNGGKACEVGLPGMICTVHCNPGYGFADAPHPTYICGISGKWFNAHASGGKRKPALPDCSKTYIPQNVLFNGRYHYLTNNCNKDLTEEIVANFKALLFGSPFGQHICGSIPDCQNNIKVDVNCGEQTRRRRDTTASVPLTVNFAVEVPLANYSNTLFDVNETSLQISNDILAALEPAASLNITGVVIVVDTTRPPEIHLTSFVCGDGQVLVGTKCVNCPVGYFFNSSSCQACAIDEYQDQEAQTSCISCPTRTSTFGQQGSKQRHDCQDLSIPTSDNGQQRMPKIKLLSIIVGVALVVVLMVVLGIWGARKCFRTTMDHAVVGFSNDAYDNTIEWEELRIKTSNA